MSNISKNENIKNDIKLRIFLKELKPNQTISERKVASFYKVSRGTAREALSKLQMERILSAIPSIGYRINVKSEDPLLVENHYYRTLNSSPKKDNFYSVKNNLSQGILTKESNDNISKVLNMETKKDLYFFCFYRVDPMINNKKIGIVYYYFPVCSLFSRKKSVKKKIELTNVLNKYRYKIKKMRAKLNFIKVSKSLALMLQVDKKQVLLQRICYFFSFNDDVLYYTIEYTLPEKAINILPSLEIAEKVGGFIE